jgi:predicted nuclease of predicted toxin-antitoxin system
VKFVLDEDVDARLVHVFEDRHHQCWTVPNAGLANAVDDDVSVYADNKKAVLITHDKELAHRRQISYFGALVFLKCSEPHACEVVERQFEDIIRLIPKHQAVVILVTPTQVKILPPISDA